jgi:hypothetical protein
MKGATKAQQSKSTKLKNLPDPERPKSAKNSNFRQVEATNEESDPDLENELDEENALNEVAGKHELSQFSGRPD